MKVNTFQLRYDGQLNQIDLQTFTKSLINISTLVQEVNAEINPLSKIEINIHALKKGSFCVDLSVISAVAATLAQSGGLQLTGLLIGVVVDLLDIKKFLEGEKSSLVEIEGDKVRVKNKNGTVNYIDQRTWNIFAGNQVVNDAITGNFESLADDPSITKFELISQEKRFESEKRDFPKLAKHQEVEDILKKEIVKHNARLSIIRVVFEDRYKWQFYYEGNKISASVIDENFLKRINEGKESFSKGDSLTVELQINQVFDQEIQLWINHSYQINKVIEHMPRDQQLELDD